jgi:hypothetical protein
MGKTSDRGIATPAYQKNVAQLLLEHDADINARILDDACPG